jgi:hypothetical protein
MYSGIGWGVSACGLKADQVFSADLNKFTK